MFLPLWPADEWKSAMMVPLPAAATTSRQASASGQQVLMLVRWSAEQDKAGCITRHAESSRVAEGNRATCTDRVVGGRLKAVVAAVQLRNRLHASSRQRPEQ